MAQTDRDPAIIVLGYGVSDSLQLTIEAQRVLNRVGSVYALHLPPNLARYLKSQRVRCVDLSDRFSAGRPFADVYLEIVELILQRTAEERPVVMLTPGNPLFLNAVTRFLVQQARARGLSIRIHPGVSQIDALISYLGLDVTTFGFQLFDAQRLVSRRQPVNPAVPLLVLQVAGFAASDFAASEAPAAGPPSDGEYAPLAECLARFYSADQCVTLINTSSNGRGPSHVTVQLSRFSELVPHVRPESSLFIDRVKKSR